ncbi:MAG TPA: hypothetical protein PKL77_09005 [Candidatus Omnitrophota bacterium]|nr:hypothetical protein [Candidatus Omnitrophota bacterium]
MKLTLKPEKKEYFESRMEELAPWMHAFKFGDSIIVGYYKYEGLGEECTWCNSRSPKETIKKLEETYALRQENIGKEFFNKVISHLPLSLSERNSSTVLDISSATGKKSLWSVDNGFGKVISSEIRKNQVDQLKLILECVTEEKYSRSIQVKNDLLSADAPEFIDSYMNPNDRPDVVLSYGLLYHLANPYQHLVNCYNITKKFLIVHSMTHYNPFAEKYWSMQIENPKWITKAVSSVSWTPHYLEIKRLCEKIGFKKVQMVYPDMFEKNFSLFKNPTTMSRAKIIGQILAHKAFGIKGGIYKNRDFNYYKYAELNPNYFAYVCEK